MRWNANEGEVHGELVGNMNMESSPIINLDTVGQEARFRRRSENSMRGKPEGMLHPLHKLSNTLARREA
jgi:hypothetical protein